MSRGIEVIVAEFFCGLAVAKIMVSELPRSCRPSIPWSTPNTKIEIGCRLTILAEVAVLPPFLLSITLWTVKYICAAQATPKQTANKATTPTSRARKFPGFSADASAANARLR